MTAMMATTSEMQARHFYPCCGDKIDTTPIVMIHGWGNDSGSWQPMLTQLNHQFDIYTLDLPGFGGAPAFSNVESALSAMEDALPGSCYLLGWSLGGMLAVRLANRKPAQVKKVITLAANACFVEHKQWPHAMKKPVFDQFSGLFDANPVSAIKQFCGLQAKGDSDEKQLLRWLRTNTPSPCSDWRGPLSWLAELDNREALSQLTVPSLHLLAENDHLIPVNAAEALQKQVTPLGRVQVIPGHGHGPHISAPQVVADICRHFYTTSVKDPYAIDKQAIASSFGRAAGTYDKVAELQRQVGDALLGMLPSASQPTALLDVGCGTGYFTDKLAYRFQDSHCVGVDLSPGMVEYAANKYGDRPTWMCADAEALPINDNSQQLIYSNFAFQWCLDLRALFAEQFRVLESGGALVFSTVGLNSLTELRHAWQQVDQYVHVNRFQALDTVRKALLAAGFSLHDQREEHLVRHYGKLQELTRELKFLGAHNINAGRKTGLTSIRQIEKFKAAYEHFRCDQGLPATWQVFYMVAIKP